MEHPQLTMLPPAVLVFRPVRQRFFHLSDTPSVKEFSVYLGGLEGGRSGTSSAVVHEEVVHALRMAVHDVVKADAPDSLKWQTFAELWDFPQSDLELLKSLPENLQAITMALQWIWSQSDLDGYVKLKNWEMEAVVRHSYELHTNTGPVRVPEFGLPLARGVHLGLLIVSSVNNMTKIVLACGCPISLESAMPWNFYDGKLMQRYYKLMSKGDTMEVLSNTEEKMMQLICKD